MNQATAKTTAPVDVYLKGVWKLLCHLYQAIKELIIGVRVNAVPWATCCGVGIFLAGLIGFRLDIFLLRKTHFFFLYPVHSPKLYFIYCLSALTSGFWVWAIFQVCRRVRLMRKLQDAFINAGLKTPRGRLPAFISDQPLDQYTKKLRLGNAGIPKRDFEKAREHIGTSLQIFIDDIKENRRTGSIDIIYSHDSMPESAVIADEIDDFPSYQFAAGTTRRGFVVENLRDVPHLLIAGQSGGGKSTFLRQFITTLYLNNKNCQFTLIDLKGGLEFQTFEDYPRIEVVPNLARAIRALDKFEKALTSRMALLKENHCKDLDAYFQLPQAKRVTTPDSKFTNLDRHIIVVDEAAEVFLAGGGSSPQDIQKTKRVLSQIARQGRAVGIHLVIATQRPDTKAIDSQVKTNLTGVLCFPMPNDASSMTVLGNGRATDLPAEIKGRAIWKKNGEMIEVQTPFLSVEETTALLSEFKNKEQSKEEKTKPQVAEPKASDTLDGSNVPSQNKTAPKDSDLHDQSE